ncbi:NINE protein [Halosimplex halobium]|uniref:zinc-ribbon domain and TM2 domain-containing protein n=1 Tax=Halosimplex halobium TaxID=3396618 RepID=UPI003F5731DB
MSNDEPDDREDHDPGDTESGQGGGQPPADDGAGDTESGQGDGQPTDDGDDGNEDSWVSDSVDEGEPTGAEGGSGDAGTVDDAGGQSTGAGGGQPAGSDGGQPAGSDGDRQKGPDEKFCSECGAVINEKAEICPECGVRQPGTGSGSDDERLIAAVLAIVLGGLGAHKFYMGKTGQGIVYLCFSWTLIPALIGLVEGIIYLTKSDEEFHEQYMAD